jgi:hypothetical protein
MAAPTANEQYMLELVNRERAKAGVQPLAFDGNLNSSADRHSRWMISTDTFSHTGVNNSQPTDRMAEAGYAFEGSWASGENIAWASVRPPTGYADEVQLLHGNLMRSAPHRANILSGGFQEIGIGFATGSYQSATGAFVTQNFARTASNPFLTGVAFDDRDGDRFYDPGEGLRGLSVKAVSGTGAVFETTTSASGGYGLPVPAGTYAVTFSGPGIATVTKTAAVGTASVKVDLVDPAGTGKVAKAGGSAADPSRTEGGARDGSHDLLRDSDRFEFGSPGVARGEAGRDGDAEPGRDRAARPGAARGPDPAEDAAGDAPQEASADRPEHRGADACGTGDRWHAIESGLHTSLPADLIL